MQELDESEETTFWLSFPDIIDSVARSRAEVQQARTCTTDEVLRWVADGLPEESQS